MAKEAKKNQITFDSVKVDLAKIGIEEKKEKELIKEVLNDVWTNYQKEHLFMLYLQANYIMSKKDAGIAQLMGNLQVKLNSSLQYINYLTNRLK